MDRKSILILVACFGLILSWQYMLQKKYPAMNHPHPATNSIANTTASNAVSFSADTNQAVAPSPALSPGRPGGNFIVRNDVPEELLVITNDNARYIFTSRGGGLKEVQLLHYPETVSSVRKKNKTTNQLATLNGPDVLPTYAILGDESLQGDGNYKLTLVPNGVQAVKGLSNGLVIIKDFQLSTNYLLTTSVRFQNDSKLPIVVPPQQWVAGTATPMDPRDNGMAQTVYWYNGKAKPVMLSYFNTNTSSFMGLVSRTPAKEFVAGSNDVSWVSAQNQFFTLLTMPHAPAESVVVHMIDLPPPTPEELQADPATIRNPKALQATLVYPGAHLDPGQALTNQFTLFAGPKEYQTLANLGARFNNDADLIMNFGFFGPVSKALLVTMNWLHFSAGLAYGIIIILITIVIKLLFWPLTQASMRSAKRMQVLQPQLKALQEKYKDDPQKFTAKQWEFYKKNKVNPMSGCLPALLQIPVFIGFYSMLRTAIELRGAPFLWIGDLSKPDTVFSLPLPLHYLGYSDGFLPLNPMPLIMAGALLWQASLTPPAPSMDASQQKIMKYMPLMMLVFMYNLSSGLALYWTVSNLLTVLQTKLTRAQVDPIVANATKTTVSVAPQKKK
ncbi:MAG TPA: membrane protein insertase YidC [Verrucomicrobiae bacterium]|jgi:YidC/Oxa1 family membrane protein insertase|nr:membrane protein insertase YidC [Verrucomicrobiae bacterium]